MEKGKLFSVRSGAKETLPAELSRNYLWHIISAAAKPHWPRIATRAVLVKFLLQRVISAVGKKFSFYKFTVIIARCCQINIECE